jgi:hypothetical protein
MLTPVPISRRTLGALLVGLLLVFAGCAGPTGSAPSPESGTSSPATETTSEPIATESPTDDSPANETTTDEEA